MSLSSAAFSSAARTARNVHVRRRNKIDGPGFHRPHATIIPTMKLLLDYVYITQGATGRGDGFNRGYGFAINAAGDITPFKGLDIRPLVSWIQLEGSTTSSYSGPCLGRGGVPAQGPCAPTAGAAAANENGGPSTIGPVPGGSPTAFGVPGTPCFEAGSVENRYTAGFDSVWRSGPPGSC